MILPILLLVFNGSYIIVLPGILKGVLSLNCLIYNGSVIVGNDGIVR